MYKNNVQKTGAAESIQIVGPLKRYIYSPYVEKQCKLKGLFFFSDRRKIYFPFLP